MDAPPIAAAEISNDFTGVPSFLSRPMQPTTAVQPSGSYHRIGWEVGRGPL